MRRTLVCITVVALALTLAASHATAVTDGQPDGNRHPNVAMIVYYNSEGRFRCSATLVSPTVLVTAAHCTEGTIGRTIVTFDTVAPAVATADPATGYTSAPAGWLAGTPHTHPLWDGELQLNDLHDVGVVVLDQPYTLATPATIAPANYLEGLSRGNGGLNKQTFEVVGYGVFFSKPTEGPQKPTSVSDRTRRFTTAVGQNATSQVLKLAENSRDARAGGGTCFGDSGGPAFHNGLLVGDTSFGASQFCRSSGGYYRLDTADARGFLDDYVAL